MVLLLPSEWRGGRAVAAFEYRRLDGLNRRRGNEGNITSGYENKVRWTERDAWMNNLNAQ